MPTSRDKNRQKESVVTTTSDKQHLVWGKDESAKLAHILCVTGSNPVVYESTRSSKGRAIGHLKDERLKGKGSKAQSFKGLKHDVSKVESCIGNDQRQVMFSFFCQPELFRLPAWVALFDRN